MKKVRPTLLLLVTCEILLPTETYIPTYVHTYVHTYIPTYIPTYIRTYMRTYLRTYVHTYIHTSPGSPGRLALRLEHVDHNAVDDVVACVRVDLGHVSRVRDVVEFVSSAFLTRCHILFLRPPRSRLI